MGTREDYQVFMEKQLNEWKAQTERFKEGAEALEEQAKVQYEKNLELLRARQEEAWEHFRKMQGAGEDAWSQWKSHLEKAGAGIKEAAEKMTSQFHKK